MQFVELISAILLGVICAFEISEATRQQVIEYELKYSSNESTQSLSANLKEIYENCTLSGVITSCSTNNRRWVIIDESF